MYRGSKDNISAMILQLGGELDNKEELPEREIYAGPFSSAADKFVAAYDAMAQDAGLLPVQMVELRYDQVKQRLAARKAATTCTDTTCDFTTLEPAEMHKILCKVCSPPACQDAKTPHTARPLRRRRRLVEKQRRVR